MGPGSTVSRLQTYLACRKHSTTKILLCDGSMERVGAVQANRANIFYFRYLLRAETVDQHGVIAIETHQYYRN